MKRKTERERFEAWAQRSGLWTVVPHLGFGRYNKGQYDYASVETAWITWQAAKRQARSAVARKEKRE